MIEALLVGAVTFLAAIAAYFWAVARVQRELIADLHSAAKERTLEAREATERLLAAWKDGVTIPAPTQELPPLPQSTEPIPSELRWIIDRWDEDLAKHKAELELRAMLDRGMSNSSILAFYERPAF